MLFLATELCACFSCLAWSRAFALSYVLSSTIGSLSLCNQTPTDAPTEAPTEKPNDEPEFIDYAAQVKFDPNSGRAVAKVTVHAAVDGDTTHFNVPTSIVSSGILKARYLGINTPESTGIIEPWGKKEHELHIIYI